MYNTRTECLIHTTSVLAWAYQKEMANFSCDANQIIWNLTYEQVNELEFLGLALNTSEWILDRFIWPFVLVFGYSTNISFVWTVFKTPSLHTNTYRYLVNLAISDLLFLIVFYIPRIQAYNMSTLISTLTTFLYALTNFFFCCSTGTITLVSLERFLAICYPIKHHLMKERRRTNKLIFSVWCSAVCLSAPYFIITRTTSNICLIWPDDSTYDDYPKQTTTWGSTNWTFELVLSINAVIFFFLMIFNNVLFFKIHLAVKARQNTNLGLNSSFDLQHRQVAHMLIVNGVFFFMCCSTQILTTPFILLVTNRSNEINMMSIFYILGLLTDILFGLNASLNPVLYLITNKRYRHAFIAVFTWSRKEKQNQNQNQTIINSIKLSNINRA